MNATRTRVLYIGDRETFDFLLAMVRGFDAGGDYEMSHISDFDEACRRIEEDPCDIYIVQCLIKGREGLELIRRYADFDRRSAFILFTDKLSLSTLTEAARCGAVDYLYKSELDESSLEKSLRVSSTIVRHSIERRESVGEIAG